MFPGSGARGDGREAGDVVWSAQGRAPGMSMLREATMDGDRVELRWVDGRPPTLVPLTWLRDHGDDDDEPDARLRQRPTYAFAIPRAPARAVALADDGRVLRVEWSDGAVGRFAAGMLAALHDDPEALPVERRLWDGDEVAAAPPSVPYAEFMGDDAALREFLEQVARFGFSFVEGVPGTAEATHAVGGRLAYARATVFGPGWWEIHHASTDGQHMAHTGQALELHTDGTYSKDPPGYQLFHCLRPARSGGETVLADGLRFAAVLEREAPEAYRVLTEVAIAAHYVDAAQGIRIVTRRPLFRLDASGAVAQVSFSNFNRAPFLLPPAQHEAFYAALARFAGLCADERRQYRRLLLPGSLLVLDNWRVLHGRTAFAGDERHIVGTYFNKEDVEARLRFLRAHAR